MKNNILLFLIIVTGFGAIPNALYATQLLTFFFKPYPAELSHHKTDKKLASLAKPGKLNREMIKLLVQKKVAGIFSTYYGFLAISDLHGQTTFPLMHAKPLLYIAISQKISPITMAYNTIDHWEFVEGSPVALYSVEKKQDPGTKINYWKVSAAQQKNNIVPLDSVTILAHPKYFYVPEGISIIKDISQTVLPPIYVKPGVHITHDALYILNLIHFFSWVPHWFKQEPKRVTIYTNTGY